MNLLQKWVSENKGIFRVVIIGQGGIGSAVDEPVTRLSLFTLPALLLPETELLKRVRLTLVDGDEWERKNRRNQDLRSVGLKVDIKAREVRETYPDSTLQIITRPVFMDEENVADIIDEGDVVLICPDNHTARRVAISRSSELDRSVVISAGNDFTTGEAQMQIRLDGEYQTPRILEYCPSIERATGSRDTSSEHCIEQHLVTNRMAAMAMLLLFNRVLNAWATGEQAPPVHEICFDIEACKLSGRSWDLKGASEVQVSGLV